MNRLILLCSATLMAACASAPPPSTASERFAEARRAIAAEPEPVDLHAALARLDGLAADCRDVAPYHALRGELTLQLADQTREVGRRGAEFLYEDAVTALDKAVALDGAAIGPRLQLARALYDCNRLEAAADRATSVLTALSDAETEDLLAAHTLRASAAGRAFVSRRAQQQDGEALLEMARTSLRELERRGRLDATLVSSWSSIEQWAGAPDEAVAVLVRAVQRQPEDVGLLQALVDGAAAIQQLPAAFAVLQTRTDAAGLWYAGRVRYLMAADERARQRTAEAFAMLDAATTCFRASMQQNPDYRDSCEQWLALCLGAKGNLAFVTGDLPHAEAWLLEATRLRPQDIADDLGGGESVKLGLLRVGDRYMRDFAKTEAFFRTAADIVGTDVDLLNNAAVYARDHATRLERAGKSEEAMLMYERSYATYCRAVLLDPQSVRLRNDCALILVHHLRRDQDTSRRLLDEAIADGERVLRDDPPADARLRQDLDEAVGDCRENLALWHLEYGGDAAAAAREAKQSLQHFPHEQRTGARRHLERAEQLLSGR